MSFVIKSQTLYRDQPRQPLLTIRQGAGSCRAICQPDGVPCMYTRIRTFRAPGESALSPRFQQYLLMDRNMKILATGLPVWAPGGDRYAKAWPMSALPRVEEVRVSVDLCPYRLWRQHEGLFLLQDNQGLEVLRFHRRGLDDNWFVQCHRYMSELLIFSLFIFCQYMEQENRL